MNPSWSLVSASSKMNHSPLVALSLPLLPHWDKLPPVNHQSCLPLYNNVRVEGTSNIQREPPEEVQRSAPINFSIESITRKPSVAIDPVAVNNEVKHQEQSDDIIKNRGRPSAVSLQILKQKSLENPFRFKCAVCLRSFPRKKSLDTHKLTHSDVKPFQCTFPNCNRKFKQSGQLKTHYRLHTGEKPFVCTFPRCETAFTHANRKCPTHPQYPLRRRIAMKKLPQFGVQTASRSFDNVFGLALDISHKKKVDAWLRSQLTVGEIANMNTIEGNRNVLGSIENKREVIKMNHENKRDDTIKLNQENIKLNQENKGEAIKMNRENKWGDTNKLNQEDRGEVIKLDHTMFEESNKRLLSAVALVELHDQTKTKVDNSHQGLLNTLFSITK